MKTQPHFSPVALACSLAPLACLLVLSTAAPASPMFTEQGVAIFGNINYEARSASLADIDNDGDLDLFYQGGAGARQLFRNNLVGGGTLTYTNITDTLPAGLNLSWSAAWGDYNGDHKIDVFVGQTNNSPDTGDVLMNRGAGVFTNESNAVGLNDPGFAQNLAWCDIDNDRDLDLLIGMEGPEKHEIYLQGANGHFTAVGAAVGFQADVGDKGYGMAVGDYDDDGDMDVYISTCRGDNNIRNNFYKNMLVESGSLSFVDVADSNGTQFTKNSYGSEFADFDDDGDLDLFMVGADHQLTKIFRNNGDGQFTDVDSILGHQLLSDLGGDYNGGKAVDYDNDGDLDLYFHDHLETPTSNNARKLFRNDGDWQFTDVTVAEGLNTVNQGGYDSTWADIDNDGDQDLIFPTGASFRERIFISDATKNDNHWLYVRLAGPTDNTTGIGAALYATIGEDTPEERTLRREANTNGNTFNQSDLPVHFGLGAATMIDELRIHWPDGTDQILRDVAVDRYLTIHTPGDFDGDGDVDGADLAQWGGDYGAEGGSEADYNGATDGADLLAWQRQLGNGVRPAASPVTASVPEPASAVLLLALSAAISIGKTRRGMA